jgi:hypothetical protein
MKMTAFWDIAPCRLGEVDYTATSQKAVIFVLIAVTT